MTPASRAARPSTAPSRGITPSSSPSVDRRGRSARARQARPGAQARRPAARFSQALIDEGFASALGVARTLAEQYHLPLVDLAVAGIDAEASKSIAAAVLERVCAIPFSDRRHAPQGRDHRSRRTCRGSTSSGSPRATRSTSTSRAKNDVLTELRRLTRASEAVNASLIDDAPSRTPSSDERRPRGRRRHLRRAARPARQLDHLPGRRGGRQRHPLRAAGARPDRALPGRRRPARRPADPETARRRRDHSPEGAREARHRRAAQAPGRPHHPQRGRRGPPARHPRRDAADGRGRDGDDAPARQVARGPDARVARALARDARAAGANRLAARRERCSSPARPAPASRRRSTPRSRRSAAPRST